MTEAIDKSCSRHIRVTKSGGIIIPNKEYLEDYEKSELEEFKKFEKILIKGKFGVNDISPPKERFTKIAEPRALVSGDARSDLWPQVPLAGSTFVLLHPVREEKFKKEHGFEVSEIDRVVDFIKETGKIQFVLEWPPTSFEGLDFLDPIFDELKPPCEPWPTDILSCLTPAQRREVMVEFDTLLHINFYNTIKKVYSEDIRQDSLVIAKRIHDFRMDYLALKELGFNDLLEQVGTLMVDDPVAALQDFIVIGAFITLPLYSALKATFNYNIDLIARAKGLKKIRKPTFPCEIGKFLMKKLIYYPESLTACQEIIANYKDYDLVKLVAALNEGIRRSDFDLVKTSNEGLSEILDNLWNDRSIQSKIEGLRVGIPVSLAALGAVALGPIGAIGGFLGGLGYSAGSTMLKIQAETIGEKIAKRFSQSYQINIYDFKNRYALR